MADRLGIIAGCGELPRRLVEYCRTAERFGGIGPVDDVIEFIRADSSRAVFQPKGENGG